MATLWAFIQGLPKDSNWLMMLAGFGIIAAAHKADKIISSGSSSAAAPPANPPA